MRSPVMFVDEQKAVVSVFYPHCHSIRPTCAAFARLEVRGKQVFLLFPRDLLFIGILT
jgi:hypothetical protein